MSKPVLPQMRSYFEQSLMVSLEAPVEWEVAAAKGHPLGLFAPPENGYRAAILFSVGRINPPIIENFEGLIEETESVLASQLPQYKNLSSERLAIDDYSAYVRVYAWQDQHKGEFTQMQAFIVTGPKITYIVEASCLSATADLYLPIFEHIVRSLRFIPPISTR